MEPPDEAVVEEVAVVDEALLDRVTVTVTVLAWDLVLDRDLVLVL